MEIIPFGSIGGDLLEGSCAMAKDKKDGFSDIGAINSRSVVKTSKSDCGMLVR